jgi:twinkle protein
VAFCKATGKEEPCQVATFRDDAGFPTTQKCRFKDKNFSIRGKNKNIGLYGQHLWRGGGKMVTITEGEIDALSLSQVTGNKWAVVSIPNGAEGAHKSVANSLEWLETFDSVVFMFDNDEPGRKAAEKCSLMLSVGKAKIATLPMKDANEMLMAGKGSELVSAQWGAKPFRPDGVVLGEDLWELVSEEDDTETFPYPWGGMNAKTYGIRLGELVVLTSGTGIGKSSICREIAHHLITNDKKVGYLALEESVKQTAKGIIGIELNVPLHIHGKEVPMDKLHDAFQATMGTGNCILYDHFGSTDTDHLIGKIRFMVHGMGAKYIFLDHISIMVSGDESGDERRRIDALMTKLATLTKELNIALIIVSHLKRPPGTAHEDGGQISLAHLRGSGAIGQLAFLVIGFERDQQSEDQADVTTCRVLKNRFSGETGVNCALEYNHTTGRLLETHRQSTVTTEKKAYER